jgi:hypothetical protein
LQIFFKKNFAAQKFPAKKEILLIALTTGARQKQIPAPRPPHPLREFPDRVVSVI